MFTLLSNLLPSNSLNLSRRSVPAVGLCPVEVHDVQTAKDKSARTLKHLLKLNHVNFAILYNDLEFHNHMPHLLSTAYLLGASAEHLHKEFEEESKELEKWTDSPSEITPDDWRSFLGKREYQRAYVDFFEDELVRYGYDWKKVVEEYLFSGERPLVNSLVSGVGHPLIHLGYAYEMSSCEVAMEALAMTASCYDYIHEYIDDSSYELDQHAQPDNSQTTSVLDLIQKIRNDTRLDGLFTSPGFSNVSVLFTDHSALLREYLHSWRITDDLTSQFHSLQHAATLLFLTTSDKPHDFFLLHLLTTSHALRILLPLVPAKFHVSMLRQWWLLTVAVYIAQLRPDLDKSRITDVDLQGRDWEWVANASMQSEFDANAHFVKGVRTLREIGNTWDGHGYHGEGDHSDGKDFYLKAAVRLVEKFDGWGGFS